MIIGAEDVVQSLSNVLLAVGGSDSAFLAQTRLRLGDIAVSKGSLVRPKLTAVEEDEEQNPSALEDENNAAWTDLRWD